MVYWYACSQLCDQINAAWWLLCGKSRKAKEYFMAFQPRHNTSKNIMRCRHRFTASVSCCHYNRISNKGFAYIMVLHRWRYVTSAFELRICPPPFLLFWWNTFSVTWYWVSPEIYSLACCFYDICIGHIYILSRHSPVCSTVCHRYKRSIFSKIFTKDTV